MYVYLFRVFTEDDEMKTFQKVAAAIIMVIAILTVIKGDSHGAQTMINTVGIILILAKLQTD